MVHSQSVWFERLAEADRPGTEQSIELVIGGEAVNKKLRLVRNPRARRYVLRVNRNGCVRVTIPRGGSAAYAVEFAKSNAAWIQKEHSRLRAEVSLPASWTDGTPILFRGEPCVITSEVQGAMRLVRFADQVIALPTQTQDYRPSIEQFLWFLAGKELPARALQLASLHGVSISRVVVRNQRSRWGSCSRKGTVSLNWRLIQAPPWVRDYLILHELMHRREMNHSPRFWAWVATVCPDYKKAEQWLDKHASLLRDSR